MRMLLIFATMILAGCASSEKITDFSDRSIIYGWVEMGSRAGNNILSVYMRQYRPQTDKPYYAMFIEKMDGGFLFYHHLFEKGSYKLDKASARSCLGIICDGTTYEYLFGRQGDSVGAVIIEQPGVYYLGSFSLERLRTGFFEERKFKIDKIEGGPSQRKMLELILSKAPEKYPEIAQRIRTALQK